MEILTSKLSPKTYMAALRSCCRFPLAMFCSERVVGIAIYRFFSVAYYAPTAEFPASAIGPSAM